MFKRTWEREHCQRDAIGAILRVFDAVHERLMLVGTIVLENI